MKIHLLTGATGFLGRYLVKALLKKGEVVWIIIRPLNNTSANERAHQIFKKLLLQYGDSLRVVSGDITHKNLGITSSIISELAKHNVIFWHLAANLSFDVKKLPAIRRTNIDGTVRVTKFANKIASRFIYISTAYVCGNSTSFKESELYKGQKLRNPYEKTKLIAEKYVRTNCKMPYTIFRPSIIIGDTYKGKAEGCTFGYYRYIFMLYFLKKQIVQTLEKTNIKSSLLKLLGTKYNKKTKILTMPCLVIPHPKNGKVNIVTVDYVIDAMLDLYQKNPSSLTAHLTHPNPPNYLFMFQAALEDIGFRNVKTFPVPSWLFKFILKCLYFLLPSIRKYIKSTMWYVPYITKNCNFDRATAKQFKKSPPEIDRELLKKINSHAKENILENIKI